MSMTSNIAIQGELERQLEKIKKMESENKSHEEILEDLKIKNSEIIEACKDGWY